MAGIAIAAGVGGGWFGGVRDPRVILPIAAFALASMATLWLATRKPVEGVAQRAAA